MKFAIATKQNGNSGEEEYLCEESGGDCYTDDIGYAILADSVEQLPERMLGEYTVAVDDSDGMEVMDS